MWWQARLPAGKQFGFGDSQGYWDLARTIARGEAFALGPDRRIFRTPGYPAVLAPLFLVRAEPPVLWGRALSAVFSTAAVGAVGGLAWLLFGQRAALVAALIAAVYPEAVAGGAFVLSEAPFTPLMILQLICWVMAWRAGGASAAAEEKVATDGTRINKDAEGIGRGLHGERGCEAKICFWGDSYREMIGWSLAAGVATALATLMRPSWLLFVPFAAVVSVGTFAAQRRNAAEGVPYRAFLIVTVTMIGLALTMSPWWLRSYLITGRFVPTTLQVGASLYDGLNPTATGASDMRFVPQFQAEQRAADREAGAEAAGTFEERVDGRLRDAAIAWAASNPGRALELAGIKFLRMWSVVPNANEFQSGMLRAVLALTYGPVMLLALLGAWKFAFRGWPYLLLVLPAIYFTLLHVIFVSSIRYRQPAMLPLIVLAAGYLMCKGRGTQQMAKAIEECKNDVVPGTLG